MNAPPPLSRSVRLVAWLFLGLGAFAAAERVRQLAAQGTLEIDLLGLALLPVGYGLLRQRDFWRKCALAVAALYMALAMLALVVSVVAFVSGPGNNIPMTFFGNPVPVSIASTVGPPLAAAAVLAGAGGAALVIRVLRSADVRRRFAA
jgi:hypothetical protein